jgi:polysaccharide biosynthesis transport protein
MRDQMLASLKTKGSDGAGDGGDSSAAMSASVDPAQTSMLLQMQGQLRSNQVEIANREHDIATLRAKIDDYQARLNQEPIREQQLADLTRGYDQSKANYDDLLKKKNESQMATSMELLQQGERFRVVDAPSFPEKPEFPNRLKFCGIGLGVGIALGIFAAGAFEMLDKRVYDERELKSLIPVPILAEIPEVTSPADQKRARRMLWLGLATAVFVVCVILAGSAFSYLRG